MNHALPLYYRVAQVAHQDQLPFALSGRWPRFRKCMLSPHCFYDDYCVKSQWLTEWHTGSETAHQKEHHSLCWETKQSPMTS